MTQEIHSKIIQNVSNAIQSLIRASKANLLLAPKRRRLAEMMINDHVSPTSDHYMAESYRKLATNVSLNNQMIEDAHFVIDMNVSSIR